MKEKIKTLDIVKIKNLCLANISPRKRKGNPQNGKQYLQIKYLIRDLCIDYIMDFSNSIIRNIPVIK